MQSNALQYEKVYDRKRNRVRGLWLREGVYYAQFGQPVGRARLTGAQTVPEAETARQVLKKRISSGDYPPKKTSTATAPAEQTTTVDHSINAAIVGYRHERKHLAGLDIKTHNREDSGLNKWSEYCGKDDIDTVDSKKLKDFAVWSRKQRMRACWTRELP